MLQPSSRTYKDVVAEIKNLNWKNLYPDDLRQLMYLSYYAAGEFAEALRIAGQLYPDNPNVQKLIAGELRTTNLTFGNYKRSADHCMFLWHFIQEGAIRPLRMVKSAGEIYSEFCRSLSDEVRAMSVFSREEELSGIFARILEAPDWSGLGLRAYRYFLEAHIRLDSEEGGHHDLTREFPVDDRVKGFYEARLNMYRSLPALFSE